MAMMLSTEMAASDDAVATLAKRVTAGRPTLVLDHGVRNSPALIPGFARVPKTAAEDVALLDLAHDDGRWHALMDLAPGTLAEDLEELAQALRIWLHGSAALPEERALALHVGAIEGSLSVREFLSWVYYDACGEKARSALEDKAGPAAWRVFLRRLGEGQASVFQDPWFGRLFLGSSPFPFEFLLTFVNLQGPRVPLDVARRTAAIVVHRALAVHSQPNRSTSADLAILVADGADIIPVIEAVAGDFIEARGAGRDLDVRLMVFDTHDDVEGGEPSKLASAIATLSRLKFTRDGGLVEAEISQPLPSKVDNLHSPDFLKGIVYGFDLFCRVADGTDLPDTLHVLREEGVTLGAATPLLDLPDSLWRHDQV